MEPHLEHTYADAVPELSVDVTPVEWPDPQVVVLDEGLAAELGLDVGWLRSADGIRWLTGHVERPTAQAYAGHQFGSYSPLLGDGRALLLGELKGRDVHVKGAGRTPFSRGGDGRATLGPMLREHLMGGWLHALGIPTTRALAVLTTGETVQRRSPEPGALLVRVGASHLRVGTVQLAAATGDVDLLARLVTYAEARHGGPLLATVCARQAELVAAWMAVGFVHGVLNTDNTALSGETIDFGPCAVLDRHDPAAVFSSIDRGGRYAYGNQPGIVQWNLARLAEALLPLDPGRLDEYRGVVDGFAGAFDDAHRRALGRRLGLDAGPPELLEDLLTLLARHQPDHTTFFRDPTAFPAFAGWVREWRALHPADVDAPRYVPRNHRVEEALAAATAGDIGPYLRLHDAVTHPHDERPDLAGLAGPAPDGAPPHVTYCGT